MADEKEVPKWTFQSLEVENASFQQKFPEKLFAEAHSAKLMQLDFTYLQYDPPV